MHFKRRARAATTSRRLLRLAMAAAVCTCGLGQAAGASEQDAKTILKAMSDYLAGQATISLTFDSDIEVITPVMEKIQFTNSGQALMQRPDKLRARRVGGYSDVELIFDGKTVNILGRSVDGYARFEAPGTIDQLIVALRAGHGVALPAADLLTSNPFEVLVADVMEAKHIGRGVVNGIECDHLAFRNFDTDWQIWVEVGERRIPRKMVITSKTLSGAPQYTLRVKDWNAGTAVDAGSFVFSPPAGAKLLAPEGLIDLDELPQARPAGGSR